MHENWKETGTFSQAIIVFLAGMVVGPLFTVALFGVPFIAIVIGMSILFTHGAPTLLSNILIIFGITVFSAESLWISINGFRFFPDNAWKTKLKKYLLYVAGALALSSVAIFYLFPLG